METIILYVDDADYLREHIGQSAPDMPAHTPLRWLLVGCSPRLPRHAGKWVTAEASQGWHEDWFDALKAQAVPLLEQQGGQVTPMLAHGPLMALTARLRREHGATRVVDLRRPKVGVDLEPVAPDHPPPARSGWAVPAAVTGLGALLILAKELMD